MPLRFTKMHGLGNDFMVLDLVRQQANLSQEQIRIWSNRHTGIGFDQLLVVEQTAIDGCDFIYRIFNADGTEVEHCGNGARCITRFVHEQGLTDANTVTFAMARGTIACHLISNSAEGLVEVDMGAPIFEPTKIPFEADAQAPLYQIMAGEHEYFVSAVSMGNPHMVLQVEDLSDTTVSQLGPVFESHTRFPNKVNVGFMQIINQQKILLRVFERGVGETAACGTGACAAMVSARQLGLVDDLVELELIGGKLSIRWDGEQNSSVWMTGPTTIVFEGEISQDYSQPFAGKFVSP
jgi:diaminopimelate epimerase